MNKYEPEKHEHLQAPFELLVLNKLARALNALILYLKLATIFVKCHHNQHHQKLTFTNHEIMKS